MTEPRRPILHLKLGAVTRPLGADAMVQPKAKTTIVTPAAALPQAPPSPPTGPVWKCRPCGSTLNLPDTLADADAVRCPACNAKVGLAGDFRSDPPNIEKLRARLAKK